MLPFDLGFFLHGGAGFPALDAAQPHDADDEHQCGMECEIRDIADHFIVVAQKFEEETGAAEKNEEERINLSAAGIVLFFSSGDTNDTNQQRDQTFQGLNGK